MTEDELRIAAQLALAHAVNLACVENTGKSAKDIVADAEVFYAFLSDTDA